MSDHDDFDRALEALQSEVTAAAAIATNDARVRQAYARQIAAYSADVIRRVRTGEITWHQGSVEANLLRNETLDLLRGRSSPIGRAIAEWLKRTGKTLNELIAHYTLQLYGEHAVFESLSAAQKDAVYVEIVRASGRSRPSVNGLMLRLSRVGRGLIVLSIAVSVYQIATSENPADTAVREAAVQGAGIAGAVAGGALAGLACGPGAPVCVAIGAFVGGAAAAFGADSWFR